MNKIKYPTLDLFIYNLTEVSDKDAYEKYWFNLPSEVEQKRLSTVTVREPEYFEFGIATRKIDGSYSRTTVDDTSCLNYCCSFDEEVELSNLPSILTELKNLALLPKIDNLPAGHLSKAGYQGQTWMMSGSMVPDNSQITEIEAIQIYQSLIADGHQYLIKGEFLGATVYEMWRGKTQWEGIEKDSHVIIVFYPDEKTFVDVVSKNYYLHWLSLFYWRQKIIWAYQQGRELKAGLAKQIQSKKDITVVSNDLSKKDLGGLKTELQQNGLNLSVYIQDINWLQIQQHTVQVNLGNYKLQCDKHFKTSVWLTEFSNIVENKYKVQLEKDYLSLNAGLALLENETTTIRGMVEIQQAQRERNLNTIIAIVGVGLGTSQITSSAIIAQKTDPENIPFYQTKALWYSIGAGAVASFSLWITILILFRLKSMLQRRFRP
ncbi:hypothetical protein Cylst_0743 [Cylindrospermum stagnale PCC 7417]|uniref:Uncharacterized protein n=1 Tax=Cylindrospermum stagnale PCC 7417 TaxID=56107 RepID=K9WRT6_9NOST|nr:hypothetical protein [Cylindrospermum stagnale]AFZ23070.1 hypothetical protein Cylst_0743 [Cylindrospermum stagnale PCC 7417]